MDRRAELALLLQRVDESIRTGESSVLVVRGEAGVGKTSLLNAFAEAAAEHHVQDGLLTGYGQAMLNSLASDSFQAVRECLRSLTKSAERAGSQDLMNRVVNSFRLHAPDWVESVPVVGKLLAAGMLTGRNILETRPSNKDMDSRLDQLIRFTEELLGHGPLLLVLDDLHWADTATIDLLAAMALRVEGPLTLVLAYRPDNLQMGEETHPLKRTVFRLRRYRSDCVEIDLERLSRPDTEQLVRLAAQQAVSARTVTQIVELSAGNPLFAESLVRIGEDAVAARASTPRLITTVLEERLSFLTSTDQRLLETAALIGDSFEVDHLAQLARMDVDDVYERLDVLLSEHGLVQAAEPRGEFDRYAMHHPLLTEVLRERGGANAPRWRRQHGKLLELLEAEHPWDDELHVRAVAIAVEAGNGAKAGQYAIAASRRQFALGSVSKARELAEISVTYTPSLDAFELLAECLSAGGNHVDASSACASAFELSRDSPAAPDRMAVLRLLWARNLRMTNNWDECRALLDELTGEDAEDAGGVEGERLAEALMLRAEIALCGPVQDTRRCIELSDMVAEMSTSPELQSRAYGHRGLSHLAAYDPDAAEIWLTRAIDVAREQDHPYAEYEAVHWLSKKTMACMELDRSWRLLEDLSRNSSSSGVAGESSWHLRDSARVLGLQGRTAEAARAIARYFDSGYTSAMSRAVTTIACQIHELEAVFDRRAADTFITEIRACCDSSMVDQDRRSRLAAHLESLDRRVPGWEPVPFAVSFLGADPAEAVAADAIFRFDVPDLSRLRSSIPDRG